MLTNKELKHAREVLTLCEQENDTELICKYKDIINFFSDQRKRLETSIIDLLNQNTKIN